MFSHECFQTLLVSLIVKDIIYHVTYLITFYLFIFFNSVLLFITCFLLERLSFVTSRILVCHHYHEYVWIMRSQRAKRNGNFYNITIYIHCTRFCFKTIRFYISSLLGDNMCFYLSSRINLFLWTITTVTRLGYI